MKLRYITPLLAAAGTAAWIAAAPTALAASSTQTCTHSGSERSCVTPGNAQINDSFEAGHTSPVPAFESGKQ